jgi:hypothetical protein
MTPGEFMDGVGELTRLLVIKHATRLNSGVFATDAVQALRHFRRPDDG